MSERTELPVDAESAARRQLAGLSRQAKAMREVLVQLLQDVVRAEQRLDSSQATQLRQANEQLVLAALDAQTDARRHDHRVGVLFLDLNDFKSINDQFGHAAGDRALQLVADCLSSLLRDSDTVSRHGGDEFLILLADVNHAASAGVIAEKINAALATYSQIDQLPVHLTASIGISVFPEDGDNAQTLIERADAAMYLAKAISHGGYVFHAQPVAGVTRRPAPPPALQPRNGDVDALTLADYVRRQHLLRDANEQLLLASLRAQDLLAGQARATSGECR